jgi:hypothetical protein
MNFSLSESAWTVASIVVNTGFFVIVQCGAIRAIHPKRLLLFSLAVFLISSAIVFCLEYVTIGYLFLSSASFRNFDLIVFVGSAGMCALYSFLGPATADRSATAHMLVFLLRYNSTLEAAILVKAFDADAFMAKRIAESAQAKIIEIDGEGIGLTAKGAMLANVFAWMITSLKIGRISGNSYLFRLPI